MIPEKHKAFIRETLKELQYAMYLTEWRIDTVYYAEDDENRKGLLAEAHPAHKYFEIEIGIYPLFFTRTEQQQREALVHEMCHVYTEPYKDMWERMARGELVTKGEEAIINERLTTMIERAVTNAYQERLEKITMTPTKKKRKGVK